MALLYMHKVAITWLLLTCDDVRTSRACSLCTTWLMSRCSLIRAAAICSLTFAPAARLLCDTQQGASTPAHSRELQVALDDWEPEKNSWCQHLRDNTFGTHNRGLTSSSAWQRAVELTRIHPIFKGVCHDHLALSSSSATAAVTPKTRLSDWVSSWSRWQNFRCRPPLERKKLTIIDEQQLTNS